MKLFKEINYDINLSPIQTISKIKSITIFSNRISTNKDEFEGKFTDNKFKVCLKSSGSIWIHNSFNPNFYGKAEAVSNYTQLSIKMRPNIAIYVVAIIMVIMFLASVYVLIYQNDLRCFISMLTFFLASILLLLWTLHMKYSDMKTVIERLFESELIEDM